MQLRRRKREMEEFNGTFKSELPTYIVVHGWKSSTRSDTVQNIKDNYLATKECNVIGMCADRAMESMANINRREFWLL